jgi:hypothetical protein
VRTKIALFAAAGMTAFMLAAVPGQQASAASSYYEQCKCYCAKEYGHNVTALPGCMGICGNYKNRPARPIAQLPEKWRRAVQFCHLYKKNM